MRTLVKDCSRFYGIPFDEVNAATRHVEDDVKKVVFKQGQDKNLFVLTYEDAMAHSPSFRAFIEKHPRVGEAITTLFKQPRSLGRHAGGVIVCDRISERMPVITSKPRGGGTERELQTPWTEGVNVKELDQFGWIKFDILGLDTLSMIERAIQLIVEKQRRQRGWFRVETDAGIEHRFGDDVAVTANRGRVPVRELAVGDDVLSVESAAVEAELP